MDERASTPTPRIATWVWLGCDAVIAAAALVWLATSQLWALLLWEALAVTYLVAGIAVVWSGSSERSGSSHSARMVASLSWVLPFFASVVGIYAAVTALSTRPSAGEAMNDSVILAIAASVGVVVSWMLLHVGFAEMYQSLDEADERAPGIEFPGIDTAAFFNYLYFSFTVGTAFATSDARVLTLRLRRVVFIHSIVSFLYNAVLIAAAIQVLQRLVAE
jgi:uncharacterized membrane protein